MMINPLLFKFLEIVQQHSLNFNEITKHDLKKEFKNNQFYNIEQFCLINKLIHINYNKYSLTLQGITFFNFLKIYIKIYK